MLNFAAVRRRTELVTLTMLERINVSGAIVGKSLNAAIGQAALENWTKASGAYYA